MGQTVVSCLRVLILAYCPHENMNRRRFLAASGGVAVSTSGCTAVRGERQLTTEDVIEHESSVVLPFTDGGEDVLQIQLDKQYTGDEQRGYYPFSISTLQPAGDRIDTLHFEFRSPPHTDGFSPAGISLREDAHAHKARLSRDGDDPSTTILALPDTTEIGRASVKVDLLLEGDHERDSQELWIRVEAVLSSDSPLGTDYEASGDLTVEFP